MPIPVVKHLHKAIPAWMRGATALLALSALVAACGGGAGALGSASETSGDEKGGRLVGGLKDGGTPAAMRSVTAHCARYGKKAFVTQMDSPAQGGQLTFVCLDR